MVEQSSKLFAESEQQPVMHTGGGTGEPGLDVDDNDSSEEEEAKAYQSKPSLIDAEFSAVTNRSKDMRFTLSQPNYPKTIMRHKPNDPQQYVSMQGNVLDSIDSYGPMPEARTVRELMDLNPGPGGMTPSGSVRMDRKGVPINRRRDGVLTKDRKIKMAHKITFADQAEGEDKLATVIYVESYKKHNVMNTV